MKISFKWLVIKYVVCLCLLPLSALAATELKIFTLQHRFAEEIISNVLPHVGEDGSATGLQNQLIVRTQASNMANITQIVESLDTGRQNLKITVRRNNDSSFNNSGVSVTGSKRIGNVEITTRRLPSQTGDNVQIGIENSQRDVRSTQQQFLNVIDGERAFIRVGQAVPFTQTWIALTRRYLSVQQTTEFVEISTGFAVRPRSLGNQITVEITPRIAKLNSSGFIDFETLTTTVRVAKGEWLDIGGIMQQKDEVSRQILSGHSHENEQNSQISIKVD